MTGLESRTNAVISCLVKVGFTSENPRTKMVAEKEKSSSSRAEQYKNNAIKKSSTVVTTTVDCSLKEQQDDRLRLRQKLPCVPYAQPALEPSQDLEL